MPENKKEYKERAPSKRDLILIKEIANGKQPREAAKIAGYSDSYIQSHLKDIVSKERIKQTIDRAMKAQGLTEDLLMEKLREGLGAMKAVVVNGSIQEVEDHTARRHYLKMALDLLNAFPDKAIKVTTNSNSLEDLLKEVAARREIDITPE